MPVVSAIDAVNQRYATLTLSPLPVLWFNTAQLVVPAGTATDFPIVILTNEPGNRATSLEAMAIQSDSFTVEVFAENLSTTRTTMEAIIWNGSPPQSKAGFWYPLTFPTPTGWLYLACIPQGLPTYDTIPDPRAPNAAQLHHATFRFVTMFDRGVA